MLGLAEIPRHTCEFPHEARERLRQFVLLCLCSWAIHFFAFTALLAIDPYPATESLSKLATIIGFVAWTLGLVALLVAGSRELLPRRRAMLGFLSVLPIATIFLSYAVYYAFWLLYHILIAVLHVTPSLV